MGESIEESAPTQFSQHDPQCSQQKLQQRVLVAAAAATALHRATVLHRVAALHRATVLQRAQVLHRAAVLQSVAASLSLGFSLTHKKCSPQNDNGGGLRGPKVGWVGLVQNTPPPSCEHCLTVSSGVVGELDCSSRMCVKLAAAASAVAAVFDGEGLVG